MLSDMFIKLWQQNLFLLGVWQTIYLTVISTVFAYVLGLPLGLLLCVITMSYSAGFQCT